VQRFFPEGDVRQLTTTRSRSEVVNGARDGARCHGATAASPRSTMRTASPFSAPIVKADAMAVRRRS
jgi:hypothetical protein